MIIKFDNTVIDNNSVMSLTRDHQLFSDSFDLGSTASAKYTIELSKQYTLPTSVSKCTIIDNNSNVIATLIIDDINNQDDSKTVYTFTDGMVNFNFSYNAKDLIDEKGGSATLKEIVQDICTKASITLSSDTFDYESMRVTWYDDTYTARDYIGFVAELNGGYAIINNLGTLEFRAFSTSYKATVNVVECDSFKVGEKHTISKVVYDNGVGTAISVGDDTGDTLYIDVNNLFVTGTDEDITAMVTSIYNKINGFTYYGVTVSKMPIPTVDVGYLIRFNLLGGYYPTIWGYYSQSYNTMWTGGITLNINSSKQTETKVIDRTTKTINSIKTVVNRQEGTISLIGQQQSEIENKLIHFQVRADQSDVIVTNQSTENPTSYTSFQGDGMSIYVDGSKVAEATASRFNCNQGLGVQDWVIQQESEGTTLNFFRKG